MAKNRFLLGESDYDLKYEFRVADLTRVERTIEDFWNKEEEIFEYLEFLNYLYMNNAFLTKEEANKIFNGLHEENKELQHKFSQQEMEYATTAYKQAEENDLLRVENEDMRRLISNISYQRDEFSRGARENANRVKKLKKENEQLRSDLENIQKETIFKSDLNKWIEKRMGYYERMMEKTEGSNYVNARGHLDMLIMLKEWIEQR